MLNLNTNGDGPQRFREELRSKTARVRLLYDLIRTAWAVESEIPPTLLGGGLSQLMSDRLSSVLSYANDRQPPFLPPSKKRSGFCDTSLLKAASTHGLSRSGDGSGAARRWTSSESDQSMITSDPPSTSSPQTGNEQTSKHMPFPADTLPVEGKSEISSSKTSHATEPNFSTDHESFASDSGNRQSEKSLLVTKLETYWKLVRENMNNKRAVENTRSAGSPIETPIKDRFPDAIDPGHGPQWPSMIGQAAARRIKAFQAAGTPSSGSGHPMHQQQMSIADKIDIQNIFKIEMPSRAEQPSDPGYDLSDKIADILRHQAIQHGIDIT